MKDEFNGFSLEGMFIEKYEEDIINEMYSQVEEILQSESTEEAKFDEIKKVLNKLNK